jgi:hypothetical protein
MWKREAAMIALCLSGTRAAHAQELHANVGYAHIFRAGGFSFATGYLHPLGAADAPARQRIGGDFWYANTDVASRPAGNAGRNVVGLGARYEVELTRCCGGVHPTAAVPVQLIHSSVPEPAGINATGRPAIELVPAPIAGPPVEDRGGSAWGWGTGVELGLRVPVSPQWNLQTSGAAMYQDVYAASTTNGAWTWHVGVSYRFGS